MKSILEELWCGNICNNGSGGLTQEERALIGYIAEHREKIQAALTEEQKEIFEKFDDCCAELADIEERKVFVYAFRLRARIAIEVMGFDAEGEI